MMLIRKTVMGGGSFLVFQSVSHFALYSGTDWIFVNLAAFPIGFMLYYPANGV